MKTLAQYLAEYLAAEGYRHNTKAKIGPKAIELMEKWITEGMDAYMAAGNCEIIIEPRLKTYACESCSLVKSGVIWREETEQYECAECYDYWRKENGL